MKLLFENWRRFVEGQRPHYRLIGNIITELTEEQLKEFPLSDEELDKIKKWGDLEGKPSLLGTGSMGSAYLFDNNKVLKITSDYQEAKAAKLIEGEDHPNVYKILKVARRWKAGDKVPKEEPRRPYAIVYEMVGEDPLLSGFGLINFPTEDQGTIIQQAEATIGTKTGAFKAWTSWTDDFESAKENFLKAAEEYDLEGEVVKQFSSEAKKLDSILDKMEGDQKSKDAIKLAFHASVGIGGNNLRSFDRVKEIVDGKKFKYVEDLASGLTFLKNKGVPFKDLKTSNVMNVDDKLIIIDIGKAVVSGYVEIETIGENK